MHHLAKFAKLLAGMGRCAAPSRPALDCCAECCAPLAPRCLKGCLQRLAQRVDQHEDCQLQGARSCLHGFRSSLQGAYNHRAPAAASRAPAATRRSPAAICRALAAPRAHLPQPVPRQQPAGRLQPQGVCRYLLGVCSCLQGHLQGAHMAPATACRATCRVPSGRLQAALANLL